MLYRSVVPFLLLLLSSRAVSQDHPGLTATPPEDGSAVTVGDQHLVPFDVTIPGTDVTFRMVPIPGGVYEMGSPENEAGRNPDEGPQRRVRVEPFWMGECEVTWAEYKNFMGLYTPFKAFQSEGLRTVTDDNLVDAVTAPTPLYEPDFTFEYGEEPDKPAVTMTQFAARQYTKWLSGITGLQFRIPTEAEWEFACRGGTSTAYSFGDDPATLARYAWFAENSGEGGVQPVRQKEPNPFGLYDMHGNAAEWVLDAYAPYVASEGIIDGTATWTRPVAPDPRVVRGGSWEFNAAGCRSAARLGSDYEIWKEYDPNLPKSPWWCTTDPSRGVGFRLLIPLRPLDREAMTAYWEIDCEDLKFDVEDRIREGRGVLGLVDKNLPAAIEALE